MTFRVLDTLREVDLIAAEDTRNSIKLLNHFEIKTPMTSYHEYNRVEKAQQIIGWLKFIEDNVLQQVEGRKKSGLGLRCRHTGNL